MLDLWVTSVIPHFIVAIFMTFCFIFTAFFFTVGFILLFDVTRAKFKPYRFDRERKIMGYKTSTGGKNCSKYFLCICCLFGLLFASVLRIYSYMVSDKQNSTLVNPELYVRSLVFFNSFLNPVIYCWKMRHIRNEIQNIMRLNCSL